ncbi:MAG TPA: hypothetical protein PKE29_17230 [Phycisphaerales bacterium]|nr:hypothetical protein [Phycisphaerales bacterium]
MNILIISGRTARHPWSAGALVARACHALAAKGHTLTLAAQSIDDESLFSSCSRLLAFDSFDQTATDWPFGFASWAAKRRRDTPHDICLSFSRVIAGDVWLPLEPSGSSWLARVRRTHSPKSLAIAVARHHGALRALASDAFFGGPPDAARSPAPRIIATGGTSAGEASRTLHRVRGLGDRVVRVDLFSMIDPPAPDQLATLRRHTRKTLRIPDHRRVLLISAPGPVGATLDGLLTAIADLARRTSDRAPLALILAKDSFALHARALRASAADHARIIGLTHRMDAALAAADAVALPHKAERGIFDSGALARLAADALRFSKPILALSGAPGYGAARLRSSQQDSPGLVVDYPTAETWSRAIRTISDDGWLERASTAAAELGAGLTFTHFADRLESVLTETAAERAEEMGQT